MQHRRLLLLGHGIAYPASAAIQKAAFKAAGLDWSYEIAEVAPEHLAAAVAALRADDVIGANVTIPHKVAVIPHLDRADGEAVEAGAVNTIHRDGELLIGSNTDVVTRGGTQLVRRARQLGLRCADGWGRFLAQGAAAFQAWTSLSAPIDAMKAALPE